MLLEAQNLTKSYGQLCVLNDVSLAVETGQVISIVGPSGAGKSTLLHILGTLDKPDKGTVKLEGVSVFGQSDKQLPKYRNQNIGFIFQFHHLLPEFTALENVCIPAFIAGQSTAVAEKRAKELLERLKLSHRIQHKPGELSGGEQQRVAVARALMMQPKLILADEPSGNLDTENAHALHQLFFDLRTEFNQTFIIVTHNDDLANMADRKIVMKDGKISS
ncbi:MAG: ABC transporter ATP-binding protein [Chitinophagales bacterium]|nr:ABC transporter ATP-binding protein [Chitinophagales bacterium]